jgi:hypothetical protein
MGGRPPQWVAGHPQKGGVGKKIKKNSKNRTIACTRGGRTTPREPHHGLLGVVRPPPIPIRGWSANQPSIFFLLTSLLFFFIFLV